MSTKSKISKRLLMKAAWALKKDRRRGWMFTFAQCLKNAWADAKKAGARYQEAMDRKYGMGKYSAKKVAARRARVVTTNASMANMADELVNYYANNTYNGD